MIVHAFNPNSVAHVPGREWTSNTSLCKPRGSVSRSGAARYRVTDNAEHVSCKACVAALEVATLRRIGFPDAAIRQFNNRHED